MAILSTAAGRWALLSAAILLPAIGPSTAVRAQAPAAGDGRPIQSSRSYALNRDMESIYYEIYEAKCLSPDARRRGEDLVREADQTTQATRAALKAGAPVDPDLADERNLSYLEGWSVAVKRALAFPPCDETVPKPALAPADVIDRSHAQSPPAAPGPSPSPPATVPDIVHDLDSSDEPVDIAKPKPVQPDTRFDLSPAQEHFAALYLLVQQGEQFGCEDADSFRKRANDIHTIAVQAGKAQAAGAPSEVDADKAADLDRRAQALLARCPHNDRPSPGFYVGVGGSYFFEPDTQIGLASALVGYRITPNVGIELQGEVGVTKEKFDNGSTFKSSTGIDWSLYPTVAGYLPVSDTTDLILRFGYGVTRFGSKATSFSGSSSSSFEDHETVGTAIVGGGAEIGIGGDSSLRVEYDRLFFHNGTEGNRVSLSFVHTFGLRASALTGFPGPGGSAKPVPPPPPAPPPPAPPPPPPPE